MLSMQHMHQTTYLQLIKLLTQQILFNQPLQQSNALPAHTLIRQCQLHSQCKILFPFFRPTYTSTASYIRPYATTACETLLSLTTRSRHNSYKTFDSSTLNNPISTKKIKRKRERERERERESEFRVILVL